MTEATLFLVFLTRPEIPLTVFELYSFAGIILDASSEANTGWVAWKLVELPLGESIFGGVPAVVFTIYSTLTRLEAIKGCYF